MKNSTYISVVIILVFGILSLFSIAENSADLSSGTQSTPKDSSKVSQDTQSTPKDSSGTKAQRKSRTNIEETPARYEVQVDETLDIARNISAVRILLNKTNKTDVNTSVHFNSTTGKWNVEFFNKNDTVNISVVINDSDKRILEFKSYPPVSWTRIKDREVVNIISSENITKNFMKTHANAPLIMNYDKVMNQWHTTILSKNSTERLRIVIDNDTKEIIQTKILSTPKPVISEREMLKMVNNIPEIKEFFVKCTRNKDCREIKIKRWYDKERGVWVIECAYKYSKKIIFINGQTGSVVENKRVIDKERLLNLIQSKERIKIFMKSHPNAKINTIYDKTSNQWHVAISYPIMPGKVKEITVIVDRETGRIVSLVAWEYSRDKFK